MSKRKGILLAGGTGSRLYPLTNVVSKHLLAVYDKPMIYYPLTILMLSNIREILIISTEHDIASYEELLKDGSQWGMKFTYAVQKHANGIAQAFVIGEDFIAQDDVALILGDNLFYGNGLGAQLVEASKINSLATVFVTPVKDPQRYGIVNLNDDLEPILVEEKPEFPKSNLAIAGLYFFPNNVIQIAKTLKPSKRGEYEVTDLIQNYLDLKKLKVCQLGRGYAWLDMGTPASYLQAANFIATLEERQGLKVACPEEIAIMKNWVTKEQILSSLERVIHTDYAKYLINILKKI